VPSTTPQERAAHKAARLQVRYRAAQVASRTAYQVAHGADPSRRAAAALTYRRAEFVACAIEERQEAQEPEAAPSVWARQLVARSLGPAYAF
jgi:hypothetical protein